MQKDLSLDENGEVALSDEFVIGRTQDVFGDRVYVYGSHDYFNGYVFCMGDYVCWSAPVSYTHLDCTLRTIIINAQMPVIQVPAKIVFLIQRI